jgi:hypothetical protein
MDEPRTHRSLDAALHAVADDDLQRGASPQVEARVLAEARAIRASRRRAAGVRYGAAAVLVAAVSAGVWTARRPPAGGSAQEVPSVPSAPAVESTEFFPLFYSRVPARGVHVVRMEVPRDALTSFGVDASGASGGSRMVVADVVVGDDGLARAIRFVNP